MMSFHSNLLKKDSFPLNQSSNLHCKKIKDYSYNPNDRIGKGFSSIVYKGTNDETSIKHYLHGFSMFILTSLALF